MAKSLVEKYEQILAQDPASTVFVELAKALIEKGDNARAIEVCKAGLGHHATSVVGRVLWGKSLINLGKPAEAMEQFDKAIAIDRDNPHAYNLIGEVLLHKGLYRSALPLLKKAVALQPNDGRVRQWLEQTQAALAGGPAPVLSDPTRVDAPTQENAIIPAVPDQRESTEVSVPAYVPAQAGGRANGHGTGETTAPGTARASGERPAIAAATTGTVRPSGERAALRPGQARSSGERPAIAAATASDPVTEGAVIPPTEENPTIPAAGSARRRPSGERPGIPVLSPSGPAGGSAPAARASGTQPGIPVLTPAARASGAHPGIPVLTPAAKPSDLPSDANAPAGEDDPFATVPKRTQSSDVLVGLTATFNALAENAPEGSAPAPAAALAPASNGASKNGEHADDPFDVVAKRSVAALRAANGLPKEERGETVPIPAPKPSPAVVDEPSIAVSQELFNDGKVEVHDPNKGGSDSGLLGDLPPPSEENPIPAPAPRAAAPAPRGVPVLNAPRNSGGGGGGGLLGDIPELEPTSSLEVPKVEVSASAAEAIAREYERELREKLAASKAKKSFLAKHWLKLAAGGVAALVLLVGAIIYLRTLSVNQGSLADALVEAKKAILQDTGASYGEALQAVARAKRMDDGVVEVWALEAYARGILYSEHGAKPDDKQAGLAALSHKGVKDEFPGLFATASYFLADGKDRADKGGEIIAANGPSAEENALAGRLLLDKGDPKGAKERFEVALKGQPNNVRVLVAVGDFSRVNGDCTKALEFYETARQISPRHPAMILGSAECRLELSQDLDAAVTEMKSLPADEDLGEDLQFRKALANGRLLAATGAPDKAIDALNDAAKRFKARGYEANLALGQAFRQAGRMADAQDAFEAALKSKPRSEEAREALIRVLVDRDRPKDALSRVASDPDSRKISLARGIAWAKAADWKRARGELERTQVNGKFPSEAVIYLALADANDGETARAQEVLEKTLAVTKKSRGEVLVALGDIHLAKGELDKAKARYEEASKDPEDVEGGCAYGRLLLKLGFPELAVEPLQKVVRRNDSHNEAHEALVRALLMTGRTGEALDDLARWKEANDKVAAAYRLSALALFQSGKVKEADKEAGHAIRYDADAPEAYRVRAAINFAEGDSKAAFKDLEKANKLDPKDPETFCEIGLAFMRAGNSAGAEAAFGAAVRENKDSACGQVGLVYSKVPNAPKTSVKELDGVAKDAPAAWDKAFAQATKSRVLLASGKTKEAKEAADEAAKLAPWSGVAQLAVALVAQRQKDPATKDAFERAVTADPSNGAIRLAYAEYLAKGGDEDQPKALDEYEQFLKIGGDEGDVSRVEKAVTALKKRLASR